LPHCGVIRCGTFANAALIAKQRKMASPIDLIGEPLRTLRLSQSSAKWLRRLVGSGNLCERCAYRKAAQNGFADWFDQGTFANAALIAK